MTQTEESRRSIINTVLIVMVGQVGCLSLVIILASVFGGLWLDKTFDTKPLFTLILLFAGIPFSIVLMLFVARRTIAKIKSNAESENELSAK
jgi:F0F1-type ATP synthase assembly protein I